MARHIDESVASFLTAVTSGLGEGYSWEPRAEDSPRAALLWWSSGLSVDPESRFLAGATEETWDELARAAGADPEQNRFAAIEQVLQTAAQARFGMEVSCTDAGPAEEPPADWTTVSVTGVSLELVLNPELEAALGGTPPEEEKQLDHPMNSVDMLMGVEIPVSVVLGRTQMRLKDLLALSHGSIVELDQELSEEVEIRVSNRAVARGEVVAVDGNYGVRILKMLPGGAMRNAG